jgi:Transposase, Mutator family
VTTVILAESDQRQARRSTVVEVTMDVQGWLRKQLERASPDLLRAMVQDFAGTLMGAEADALCGAPYGERSPERVNVRNGYRERAWDTRVGTIELAIPKLRALRGGYPPNVCTLTRPALHPPGVTTAHGAALRPLRCPRRNGRGRLYRSAQPQPVAEGLLDG